jgi:tetratricopeptide (TPR) repeat protein
MRMPLWFPVAVLAAAAVAGMPTWLRAAGGRWRAAVALALGLGGAVVAWGDWWGVRSEDFRQVEYLRFSNAAFRLGRHAQALAWADQAAAVGPYPTLPGIRGQALYGLERYEDALASFQEAVRTVPGDAASAFNAAVILVQVKDDRAAALRFLDEALRRRPGHPQALALRQSLVPASPPPPPATAVHPHRQGDKHEAATAP